VNHFFEYKQKKEIVKNKMKSNKLIVIFFTSNINTALFKFVNKPLVFVSDYCDFYCIYDINESIKNVFIVK